MHDVRTARAEGGTRVRHERPADRPRLSAVAQARLFGLLVALAGLATVASALSEPWRDRLHAAEEVLSVEGTRLASGTAALVGLSLIVVGRGVAQRRRLAFFATIGLLAAATLAHLARGLDVDAAAVTAALAGLLWWRRRLFVVPLPPARLGELARLAGMMLGLAVCYGVVGLVFHANRATPSLTPGRVAGEVTSRLVGLPGPLAVSGGFEHWFPDSLTALGAATVAAVLLAALAPVAQRGAGPAAEREEVRRLLHRGDGDTLDPFVLRRDKRWVFAPDRRAVIGYRYVRGVGLATGDPVGNPAEFVDAMQAFLDTCESHGWRPALVGARSDRLPIYRWLGLRTISIGDEAIIDVDTFSLAGRRMRPVRQAVHRADNAGVKTEVLREGELDADLRQVLLDVAGAQRAAYREFGFSMALGDLLTGAHPECLVVICRDRDGAPVAFQRYTPCRGGHALSLDTMRRRPDAPGGVNERMIVEAVEWASANGASEVSLNFAAFRSLLDPDADTEPGQAMETFLVQRVEGRFGIQMDSLRRFNAKFHPRWVNRHLIYRSPADLPAVALAALSAEGYLPFDPGRCP